MKISVVICTYNRGAYLSDLFDSIEKQDFNKADFEIILVDNNSTDNTKEICNAFIEKNIDMNVSYASETKQGLSFARNRGIKESEGDIIVFLDDDALVFKNYLTEINRFFNDNTHIFAGGGKILPKYENKRPIWMSSFLEPVVSVLNMGENIKEFRNNQYPIGASMFMRKEVFKTIGTFNTKLGRTGKKLIGGEEKDLFLRLKKAGYKLYYLPRAVIYHVIPDSRLTNQFIKKLAVGIGQSEKLRTLEIGTGEAVKSYMKELFKWGASIVLFLFYALSFKFPKAIMIIRFRSWVSSGLYK
jgi:glycosyltransferase involved in cell wall biosynthesis